MLPSLVSLRRRLDALIEQKARQGFAVGGFKEELARLPDSYDALVALEERLSRAPLRADWPYSEPDDLEAIWAECDPARPRGPLAPLDLDDACRRAQAAFLGGVAGCILGKPLEVLPTLSEIRTAAEAVGEWPLHDYIPEAMLDALGRRHFSWAEVVRERIRYVAPDDDLNYAILGLMLLEAKGADFDTPDVVNLWLENLPPLVTWGPERNALLDAARYAHTSEACPWQSWADHWNHGDEACGAAIRVDVYGYGCAGRPDLAAELAWRDARWTHRRTGIYGAMFIAAATAAAFVVPDRLAMFDVALQFVPQQSRFHKAVSECLHLVRQATDWLDGYERIHARYGEFGHCTLYQEVGTLINTLRFAPTVGEGICMQVAQGNDTDCFGKIAGSLLGAHLGPGHLEERWLAPFNDTIHTMVAGWYELSLSAVAARMGELPRRVQGV